jgi:hypothetical protein
LDFFFGFFDEEHNGAEGGGAGSIKCKAPQLLSEHFHNSAFGDKTRINIKGFPHLVHIIYNPPIELSMNESLTKKAIEVKRKGRETTRLSKRATVKIKK